MQVLNILFFLLGFFTAASYIHKCYCFISKNICLEMDLWKWQCYYVLLGVQNLSQLIREKTPWLPWKWYGLPCHYDMCKAIKYTSFEMIRILGIVTYALGRLIYYEIFAWGIICDMVKQSTHSPLFFWWPAQKFYA